MIQSSEHSHAPQKSSSPSESSDTLKLAREVTDDAVRAYNAARFRAERAESLAKSDPAFEFWSMVATVAAQSAEAQLLRTVLAWEPGFLDLHIDRAEKLHLRPRGLRVGRSYYLALPDPANDPTEDARGANAMHLAVIPAGSIIDLDAKGEA